MAGVRVAVRVVILGVMLSLLGNGLWAKPAVAAAECKDVVFIGVRGSGETEQDDGGLGPTVKQILDGFVQNVSGRRSVSVDHINYPAHSTELLDPRKQPSLEYGLRRYLAGVDQGVRALWDEIADIAGRCNSWIVLAGYSQGALVVREALTGLSGTQLAKIGGIALVADPARHGGGDGFWQAGGAQGSGRNGIFEAVLRVRVGDLPAGTRGFAGSYCTKDDPVCDFTLGGVVSHMALHSKYKDNSKAKLAGIYMGQDLLELQSRPRPETPTPPTQQPPVVPQTPSGNYVSTCNLNGAANCSGVILRSKPIWPDNRIGSLGEKTQVSVVCAMQGTWIRDDRGNSSNWWAWIQASDGRAGYVNYLYVWGGFSAPPSCSPALSAAANGEISGSFRAQSTIHFSFPLRNDSPLPVRIDAMVLMVRGPAEQNLDVTCANSAVTINPGEVWTCHADLLLPWGGSYHGHLLWKISEGDWTDGGTPGNPYWTWSIQDIADSPLIGLSQDLEGAGTAPGTTSTAVEVLRNATNRTLTIPSIVHRVREPSGAVKTVTCGSNVTLTPDQAFTCRAPYKFPAEGTYTSWLEYQLPDGSWYSGRVFQPDITYTIFVPKIPKVELAGFSINTEAVEATALEAEFTFRNSGNAPASFYPMIFSEPLLYGGFGECIDIDYSGTDIAGAAVTLAPGATYRCVTHEVLPVGSAGRHQLTAVAHMVTSGSLAEIKQFPMRDVTVAAKPPAPVAAPVPAAPAPLPIEVAAASSFITIEPPAQAPPAAIPSPAALVWRPVAFPKKKTALISWAADPGSSSYQYRISKKNSTKKFGKWKTTKSTQVLVKKLKRRGKYTIQARGLGTGQGPVTVLTFKQAK